LTKVVSVVYYTSADMI